MKIFVQIQKDLVFLGINPSESNRINWKIAMGLLLFGLNILSVVTFIFSIENDNNLMDYVNGFCIFCAMCELCVCLLAIVWQKTKVFQVIGSFEKLINKSIPSPLDSNEILKKLVVGLDKNLKCYTFRAVFWNFKSNLCGRKSAR